MSSSKTLFASYRSHKTRRFIVSRVILIAFTGRTLKAFLKITFIAIYVFVFFSLLNHKCNNKTITLPG